MRIVQHLQEFIGKPHQQLWCKNPLIEGDSDLKESLYFWKQEILSYTKKYFPIPAQIPY